MSLLRKLSHKNLFQRKNSYSSEGFSVDVAFEENVEYDVDVDIFSGVETHSDSSFDRPSTRKVSGRELGSLNDKARKVLGVTERGYSVLPEMKKKRTGRRRASVRW